MSHSFEPVLSVATTKKLQAHNLISSRPNDVASWILQPLPFSMMFERIKFHNGQIPCGFNTPSYLLYLGFRPLIAIGIFSRCQEQRNPTRLALMESVNSHVDLKWSKSPCTLTLTSTSTSTSSTQVVVVWGNTPLGNSIMADMGLYDEVIAEVNVLWELARQDPSIMNRYLNERSNSNNLDGDGNNEFEDLTLADFVKEVLIERMNKLLVLEIDVNLHLN